MKFFRLPKSGGQNRLNKLPWGQACLADQGGRAIHFPMM